MLCGRAAVVTDVGGNAEWIEDGQTGFVAEAATAKSFGRALERAWLARGEWEKMGIGARSKALMKFDKSAGKSLLKVLLDASYSYRPNLLPLESSVLTDGINGYEDWSRESGVSSEPVSCLKPECDTRPPNLKPS